jgi:hypothetical protein
MTINAVYRSGNTPILLADYLATRPTAGGHIQIPTVEEITAPDSVVALVRKARLLLPNLVVAGSGDGNAIESIFQRLNNFAVGGLSFDELRDYLDLQDNLADCTIVGHLVTDEIYTFRWNSTDQSFLLDDKFVEGSGRHLFADVLPHINLGQAAAGYDFEVAREAAVNAATTLIGNEVSSGNTIAEKFGGGYDIYVWDGYAFRLLDNIVYLFYRIAFPNERDIRVYPMPFYVKIFAIDDYMGVMTFLNNTAVSKLKGEPHQRISIVPPIPPSAAQVPDRQIADIELTAPLYGIGMIGPNLAGRDEIFTAVLAGNGYAAELVKIFMTGAKKENLHEVRFELPDTVMNNILVAAVRRLGREAWLGPPS